MRSNSAVSAFFNLQQKLFLTIKENTVGLHMLCVIDTDNASRAKEKLPSFSFEILRQYKTM